ncbi:MAG: hypothetical protein AAF492_26565, partial [Verrucomicrobiota bacterium]
SGKDSVYHQIQAPNKSKSSAFRFSVFFKIIIISSSSTNPVKKSVQNLKITFPNGQMIFKFQPDHKICRRRILIIDSWFAFCAWKRWSGFIGTDGSPRSVKPQAR